MQLGDLESQALPAPDQPSTANACDEPKSDVTSSISVSAALPNAKSSGWRSHQARLRVAWRLMQEKRREVSAMIVLILMAILWLDTGGAGSQGRVVARRGAGAPHPVGAALKRRHRNSVRHGPRPRIR